MKTKYYLFGGQVAAPAYRWKGYTLPGLTRVAAETRGLSGVRFDDLADAADALGRDPEVEFLPYRASGPEPLDPGEGGSLAGFDLTAERLFLIAAAGFVGHWLGRRRAG